MSKEENREEKIAKYFQRKKVERSAYYIYYEINSREDKDIIASHKGPFKSYETAKKFCDNMNPRWMAHLPTFFYSEIIEVEVEGK